MRGISPNQNQGNLFYTPLRDLLNPSHSLYQLAHQINWQQFEDSFGSLYASTGRPSHPIRLMVGLLILKQVENLGDETVVEKWVENPYYQYFCGMATFQWQVPIDPSDLVYFRKRIGSEGAERIMQASVAIHGQSAHEAEITLDTTVASKAITYPTDAKLHKRIVEHCWRIAKAEGIKLRQSYKRTIKKYMRSQYNSDHPKRRKRARRELRKIRTLTGRLVRDLARKLPQDRFDHYAEHFARFHRIMTQARKDSDKLYALHAPEVSCISKGKAHPKYEFGAKVSIAQTSQSGIIVAAQSFEGNPHDSQTLTATLLHYHRNLEALPKGVIVDRGFPGPKTTLGVPIIRPDKPKTDKSPYQKRKARKRFRRRAAIEPTIGHLKHRFRLNRNWLKGAEGDQFNLLMAAAAFNFKKWLNQRAILFVFTRIWASIPLNPIFCYRA